LLTVQNLVRCEAHREVLETIFLNESNARKQL
jgi:hypothetical protein